MKREQCSMSAERLTESDARTLYRFGVELALLARLKGDGHTDQCARWLVFDDDVAECSCEASR